jgi:hypothetical protein
MMMVTLELTENEAVTLRNLLDVAVRHEGMRAAEFALYMDRKIVMAAQLAGAPPSAQGNGVGAAK